MEVDNFCLKLFVVSVILLSICSQNVPSPHTIGAKKLVEYPLPELQYGLDDLEPFIDGATVRAHYSGHHETYRKKMNNILKEWRLVNQSETSDLPYLNLYDILINLDQLPQAFQTGIKNNVGGYINHALYWSILSPNTDKIDRKPGKELLEQINKDFGSFEKFKDVFTSEALTLFGSGYLWLVSQITGNVPPRLLIFPSANQDCPLSVQFYPILVLDVWEHAYYLKHQFRRNEYLDNFWSLVDWEKVDKLNSFWKGYFGASPLDREDL